MLNDKETILSFDRLSTHNMRMLHSSSIALSLFLRKIRIRFLLSTALLFLVAAACIFDFQVSKTFRTFSTDQGSPTGIGSPRTTSIVSHHGTRQSSDISLLENTTSFPTKKMHTNASSTGLTLQLPNDNTIVSSSTRSGSVPERTTEILAYSRARNDRFGSSLVQMLLGDAYAFAHNWTYVGACRTNDPGEVARSKDPKKDELLARMGLTHWEPHGIPCPPQNSSTGGFEMITPIHHHQNDIARWITEDYLQLLHRKMNLTEQQQTRHVFSNEFVVAVHIRRGDIDPCFGRAAGKQKLRYLPNYYYLATIDRIVRQSLAEGETRPMRVEIFVEEAWNETTATESMAPFYDRGYQIYAGGDEFDVWQSMIQSDAFVMSNSFFSSLPALLKTRGDVYFPVPPDLEMKESMKMAVWKSPTAVVKNRTMIEREKLFQQCPFDRNEGRKGRMKRERKESAEKSED